MFGISLEDLFRNYLSSAVLIFINLGIGMSLTVKDFKNVLLYPRAISVGLMCSLILLPALTTLAVSFTDFSPSVKAGIVLVMSCPGGATANLIVHLLRGNVALSISMTSLTSLISLISVPLTVNIAFMLFANHAESFSLDFWEVVGRIFILILIPCAVGMYFRNRNEALALKLERPHSILATLLMAAVYVGIMVFKESKGGGTPPNYAQIGLFVLCLNIGGMFTGYFVSRILRLDHPSQMTVGIEVGLHNSVLAINIAQNSLHNDDMAVVGVIYGSFTFFSAVLFGLMVNWKNVSARFRERNNLPK